MGKRLGSPYPDLITRLILKTNLVLILNWSIFVPEDEVMEKVLVEEAHQSLYTIHLRITKIYQDLREFF